MRVLHLSKRIAATGVATALTAGAMIAVAPAATAAPASSTYTCTTPSFSFEIPVSLDATGIPATMAAGQQIAADTVAMALVFTAPPTLVSVLNTYGFSSLTTQEFSLPVGNSAIPLDGVELTGPPAPGDGGTLVLGAAGKSGAFTAPAAGSFDVMMPTDFVLSVTTTAIGTIPVPCTTASPSPAAAEKVAVTKNASTTSAKPAAVPFHKGKAAKMAVRVSAPNHTPSGRVTIKQGTKTLGSGMLSSLGKVVVNMGSRLAVGSHKVVISYPGDGYTTASKKTLTFKVVR